MLALLWLGGFDLRVTLLAVPPAIPAIHRDLGLDEKGIAVLTGLPVLLLALAAIPGSLLIARLGPRRALLTGLALTAVAGALRGIGPSLTALYSMTFLMGAGVAVSQPAYPTLAREWFPARAALATAVYSNGLLFGEMIPASATGPLVMPALRGSWPLSFLFWSAPVLLAAALLSFFTPNVRRDAGLVPPRWWPDFRDRQTWQIGLVMGFASAAYFGTNTFLPDYVIATGRPQFKDAALAAINTFQLPASFLVLALPDRLVGRRWPFVAAALAIGLACLALVISPGGWVVVWAGAIGFAAALALILTLALPPQLAPARDVHRFSAGIFLIIYAFSFIGPLAGGAAWDATHAPASAFLTLAAGGLVMAMLAATSNLRPRHDSAP